MIYVGDDTEVSDVLHILARAQRFKVQRSGLWVQRFKAVEHLRCRKIHISLARQGQSDGLTLNLKPVNLSYLNPEPQLVNIII